MRASAGERWYLYVLRCGDGSLYTGISNDVRRRLAAHAAGKGAAYTRGRGPLELLYRRGFDGKSAALRAELRFKALTREAKLAFLDRLAARRRRRAARRASPLS